MSATVLAHAERLLVVTDARILIFGGRRPLGPKEREFFGEHHRDVMFGSTPRAHLRTDAMGEPLYVAKSEYPELAKADAALIARRVAQ